MSRTVTVGTGLEAAERPVPEPGALLARLQPPRARPRLRRRAAAAGARPLLLHRLVQPGRVLHGPGGRPGAQVAAGVATRSAGRPHARGRRWPISASGSARWSSRQSTLWTDELAPALAAEGIAVVDVDECTADELAELDRRFEGEIYPVLTPLAVGPGQPFPYISGLSSSLGVLVRDPEDGEERFARVKVPEALPRFVPAGATAGWCRWRGDRALPALAVPGHGDGRARRSSGSPATPTSSSRTRPTTCWRRSSWSCAGGGSATWCGWRCRPACRRRCWTGWSRAWRRRRPGLPIGACSTWPTCPDRRPRPARAQVRAVGPGHAAPGCAPRPTRATCSRDPPRRSAGAPALRLVHDQRRGVRADRRAATRACSRIKTTVYRTSEDSAADAGADRGRRAASRRSAWSS